jgi:WXG100 family type VII secretion target
VSGFRVTPEQLQSLSGRVRGGAGSIESELRGLAGSLAPLGSDWAGVAQARFTELWSEWQTSAERLNAALTGISELLGQAGTAYATAEEQVARSFSVR